jgi:lipopolysaccharide export LptBFGC system permease protein LptF
VHVEIDHERMRRVRAETYARLGDGLNARVHTRLMSTSDLREEIAEVENSGLSAVPFRVAYWLMWATPVSCLILPALALFFSVSGPPYPTLAAAGILCVVVAVSFTLLSGVTTSLGAAGVLSPWVAGWAPAVLYGAIAAFFGSRLPGSLRTS